jgi:hypothetical protein
MRSSALIGALAALAAFLWPASAATIVSESRITVSGGAIAGETFTFPRVNGDWFVTPGDGHASLALRTAASAAHPAQLNIEWDGKAATHTINAGNNDLVGGDHKASFYVHLQAPYYQTLQPKGADAITITIVRMDDLSIEANIEGTATGAGSMRITGVIKIHRDVSDQKVGGTYLNCDPGIHDKLAGAEFRSPSECEVKFDFHVRQALAGAFTHTAAALTQGDWEQVRQPNLEAITSLPRQTEHSPYRLDLSYQFRLWPGSEQARRNQAALDALTPKMVEAIKSAAAASAYQAELTKLTHATEGSGTIRIDIGINLASKGIVNFEGTYTTAQIPGVGYSLTAPYVQSRSGGDFSGSHETTYIFLGDWTPATSAKSGSGENILVKANLNPAAPTLAVQNMCVEIQANAELAQRVIGLVDWSALRQLLAAK